MLFAWSTVVTSLVSQIWWFKSDFKGPGYRFCNVFVSDIAAFTIVCRHLLSIKITIVLTWTRAFRTNCMWSRMILLNKVCHTVGKTSRERLCFPDRRPQFRMFPGLVCLHAFLAEEKQLQETHKQGYFVFLPLPSCANSFYPSKSFPAVPAAPSAPPQMQDHSPYLLPSLRPHHIPSLPCTPAHVSTLRTHWKHITPGLTNIVVPLDPALARGMCTVAWEVLPSCASALQWNTCCLEDTGQCTSGKTGYRQITGCSKAAMLILVCYCFL